MLYAIADMPHNDLETRRWLLVLRNACVASVVIGIVWFIGGMLAKRQWAGLPEESQSLATVIGSMPQAASHLHLSVLPILNRIPEPNAALQIAFENDGDEAGTLDLVFVPPANACLQVTPSTFRSIPLAAHQAGQQSFSIASANCTAQFPFSVPLQLQYTWTLPHERSHKRSISENPADNVQLHPSSGDTSPSPAINLSIHMPGGHPASGRVPARPQRSFSAFLTTSPITFTSAKTLSDQRGWQLAGSLARNFTWPILLVILGLLGQASLARRGEQQEILEALLPTLTELMQSHYLPIVRRMQRVAIELEGFPTLVPPNAYAASKPLRRAFITILLMRRQLIHLANTKGGVFFRSALAEDIYSSGVGSFYSKFMSVTGDGDLCETIALSLAIDAMPHQAEPTIFPPPPGGQPANDLLFQNFAAWAIDPAGNLSPQFTEYLVLLDLCQAILSFEFDRVFYQTSIDVRPVFKSWYFDPPAFEFFGDPRQIPGSLHGEILPLYIRYLNGMPRRCRKNAKYP
jgi:hypothetical protein